ncbi:MAG: tetratricopeptide repeat protein [Candidatus Obscuribacterales bacterium]|nr:tetratricopeptide repeat protein [Candidatus Obscuribacterales bacterium]
MSTSTGHALSVASIQLERGNLEYATQIVSKILAIEPDNVDALHIMSMVCYLRKDIERALDFNRRACRVLPDDVKLLLTLGNFLKAKQDFPACRQAYERALSLDRSCFPAQFNLALVPSLMKESDAAVKAFKRARLMKSDFAPVDQNLGLELLSQKKYPEAISSLKKALAIEPGLLEAIEGLGNAYFELGDYDKAEKQYKLAVEKGSQSKQVLARLEEGPCRAGS